MAPGGRVQRLCAEYYATFVPALWEGNVLAFFNEVGAAYRVNQGGTADLTSVRAVQDRCFLLHGFP